MLRSRSVALLSNAIKITIAFTNYFGGTARDGVESDRVGERDRVDDTASEQQKVQIFNRVCPG